MSFDPAAYLAHVDDLDMGQSAKIEMIRVVGTIMQSFVDRAFGDAPEQILLGIDRSPARRASADGLDSGDTITSTFNDASRETHARKSPP